LFLENLLGKTALPCANGSPPVREGGTPRLTGEECRSIRGWAVRRYAWIVRLRAWICAVMRLGVPDVRRYARIGSHPAREGIKGWAYMKK